MKLLILFLSFKVPMSYESISAKEIENELNNLPTLHPKLVTVAEADNGMSAGFREFKVTFSDSLGIITYKRY